MRDHAGGAPLDQPPATAATGEATRMNDDQDRDRRGALIGLGITIVLLVAGWWLARELTSASRMQDCLMSGRTNCNPIDAPAN